MTDLQRGLWIKMLRLIVEYQEGRIPLYHLVNALEETLDQADFHDRELVRGWYESWEPLEEIDMDSSHDLWEADFSKVQPHLQRMKRFLFQQQELLAPSGRAQKGHAPLVQSR